MSGAPGAEHELRAGIEIGGRVEQMRQPLLPRHAPDEEHDGPIGVDPEPDEASGAVVGRELVGVDPVVDHDHAAGIDRRVGS